MFWYAICKWDNGTHRICRAEILSFSSSWALLKSDSMIWVPLLWEVFSSSISLSRRLERSCSWALHKIKQFVHLHTLLKIQGTLLASTVPWRTFDIHETIPLHKRFYWSNIKIFFTLRFFFFFLRTVYWKVPKMVLLWHCFPLLELLFLRM